jgi:DNA-binding LytR/AlgR family response regulator
LRIHRSHWIARDHLSKVVTRNKKSFAVMSDGRELPISKTYLGAVTAAHLQSAG